MLEQRSRHRAGRQEGLVNAASGKAGEPHPGSPPEAARSPCFLLLRLSCVLSRGHRSQPALQGDEH